MTNLFNAIHAIVQGAISSDWASMGAGIVNTVASGIALLFPWNWF